MKLISSLYGQIIHSVSQVHFDRLMNYYFISMFAVLLLLGFFVFYFQRKTIIALIALYLSLLISGAIPVEIYALQVLKFSYAPLITFLLLYCILTLLCLFVFSGKRLVRQEFGRLSLLAISVSFLGLLISSLTITAPEFLVHYSLRNFEWLFNSIRDRTIWLFISILALALSAILNRK